MNGQFVMYQPEDERDPTLSFPIPGESGEWEDLRCKPQAGDRSEVVAIPFFAFDVNLGDMVRVVRSGREEDIPKVIAHGGSHTMRVMFERESFMGEHWGRLTEDLEPFGCWFENWSDTLVAVSVNTQSLAAVTKYLADREARRELRYESGRLSQSSSAVAAAILAT